MKVLELIKKLHQEESGQDLVEYALVLVAVGGAVVAGSSAIATVISDGMTGVSTQIQTYFTDAAA